MSKQVSRRGFLIAITGTAVAAAAGCASRSYTPPTPYVPGSGIKGPSSGSANATPSAQALNSGKPDPNYGAVTFDKIITTSNDELYDTQYDYGNTPSVDASTWQLKIDGLVTTPLTLDLPTIKTYPVYEDTRTLECISNPVGGNIIGNVPWKGFKFEEILKQIGVKPEAQYVKFEAADGYHTSVKIEWITQPNVMMAYEMNGGPLTVKHGFPLRILMPGLYGQKMPRWLTHIEFIATEFVGYWEGGGWSDIADIQTNSIIKSPDGNGQPVTAGDTVAIQGLAFGGKRAITKVEISINKGDWMAADLTHGPSPLSWTQWVFKWVPPASGDYTIAARATDDTGYTQNHTADDAFGSAFPNGTGAIHQVNVTAASPS